MIHRSLQYYWCPTSPHPTTTTKAYNIQKHFFLQHILFANMIHKNGTHHTTTDGGWHNFHTITIENWYNCTHQWEIIISIGSGISYVSYIQLVSCDHIGLHHLWSIVLILSIFESVVILGWFRRLLSQTTDVLSTINKLLS